MFLVGQYRPAELMLWSSPRYVVATSRRGLNEELNKIVPGESANSLTYLHTGRDGAVRVVVDCDGTMAVDAWRLRETTRKPE